MYHISAHSLNLPRKNLRAAFILPSLVSVSSRCSAILLSLFSRVSNRFSGVVILSTLPNSSLMKTQFESSVLRSRALILADSRPPCSLSSVRYCPTLPPISSGLPVNTALIISGACLAVYAPARTAILLPSTGLPSASRQVEPMLYAVRSAISRPILLTANIGLQVVYAEPQAEVTLPNAL